MLLNKIKEALKTFFKKSKICKCCEKWILKNDIFMNRFVAIRKRFLRYNQTGYVEYSCLYVINSPFASNRLNGYLLHHKLLPYCLIDSSMI